MKMSPAYHREIPLGTRVKLPKTWGESPTPAVRVDFLRKDLRRFGGSRPHEDEGDERQSEVPVRI